MNSCSVMRWFQAATVAIFLTGFLMVIGLPQLIEFPTNLFGLGLTMLGMLLMLAAPVLLLVNLAMRTIPGLRDMFKPCA